MDNPSSAVEVLVHGANTLFILMGAVMVLAMHAGFAFLEVGTVRLKNQVNALSKIIADFAVSTLAYFFIGYWVAYGVTFLQPADQLIAENGYSLVKFFFLLTFAAAIPAIISGGIAERAKFGPQLRATLLIVAFIYPFFEGLMWNGNLGLQAWLEAQFGAPFHDFAGSVVVHGMGGWLAFGAVILLGRTQWPISRRPSGGLCAIEHSIPGAGVVDSYRRLVRLQRDECPDPGRGQWAGGDQFADGDGWRDGCRLGGRPKRPWLPA